MRSSSGCLYCPEVVKWPKHIHTNKHTHRHFLQVSADGPVLSTAGLLLDKSKTDPDASHYRWGCLQGTTPLRREPSFLSRLVMGTCCAYIVITNPTVCRLSCRQQAPPNQSSFASSSSSCLTTFCLIWAAGTSFPQVESFILLALIHFFLLLGLCPAGLIGCPKQN